MEIYFHLQKIKKGFVDIHASTEELASYKLKESILEKYNLKDGRSYRIIGVERIS